MAESEWPLFFTYLIREALFRGDIATADAYFAKLFKTLVPHEVAGAGKVMYVSASPCSLPCSPAQPHAQFHDTLHFLTRCIS